MSAAADDLSRHGEALIGAVEDMHRQLLGDIRAGVAEGTYDGIKRAIEDKTMLDSYWRGGFDRVSEHASKEASQWVGKRMLTAFFVALFGFSVAWLVKLGVFK